MKILATENVLINGQRIAYGVYGTGSPVVLLHGTPSSSLIWRNIVTKLVDAGYKVHLYDLLGYGLSERPWDPSVDTSISGQVPILEGLLKHWTLDSKPSGYHLIAHDIGGAVAQRFAILSPLKPTIRTLTMIDCVSYDSYPSPRTRQLLSSGLDNLIKASTTDHSTHFHDWLLSAVVNKPRFEKDALTTYLNYISGPIGQASIFDHQIRHYDPKHTLEIADRYHELGNWPVKLIWGAQDAWQVVDWAYKLRGAIPGAELDVVEEAGHFSLEDQPERIAGILIEFLGANS